MAGRQQHTDLEAAAYVRTRGDLAVVCLDDGLHDRQAQPGSLGRAGFRVRIETAERLEEGLDFRVLDDWAAVGRDTRQR